MNELLNRLKSENSIRHDFAFYKLTAEEICNPYLVLQDFFSMGYLPEVREKLWEFFKVTITGTYPQKLDDEEKTHINCLYEYLEKLVEAAHLINEIEMKKNFILARNADSATYP